VNKVAPCAGDCVFCETVSASAASAESPRREAQEYEIGAGFYSRTDAARYVRVYEVQ